MEAVLAVFGNLFDSVTTVVTTATQTPMMLIGVAASVGGIAISWFKRMTGQRRGKGRG